MVVEITTRAKLLSMTMCVRPASTLAILLFLAVSAQIGAQQPTISEEQRITSVELYVGVERGWLKKWLTGRVDPGSGFDGDELRLTIDGERVDVSSVTTAEDLEESWQVVIFFDAVLHHQTGLRSSARALADLVPQLVGLGEVEVVVADPSPRVVLAPTRDEESLAAALSDIAFFGKAEDLLPSIRQEYLDLLEEDPPGEGTDLAASLADEERRIVAERRDVLGRYLIEEAAPGRGRAVIWVAEGFDAAPERFYLSSSIDSESVLSSSLSPWARTIAAYGWTALPFAVKGQGPGLRKGFRIGKWRFGVLRAVYEAERRPAEARALVELGDVRFALGEADEAAAAYEQALHHFLGDQKTAGEQAQVWLRMGRVQRARGDLGRSRQAFANAVELDPALESELGSAAAYFANVLLGHQELADVSGGALIRSRGDLGRALEELVGRVRITFELAGRPSGELLELALSSDPEGRGLRHAAWTRSGVPPEVAAIRLRSALREQAREPPEGETTVVLEPISATGRYRVAVDPGEIGLDRVWIGVADFQREPVVTPLVRLPEGIWIAELELPSSDDVVALYREDLAAGQWSVEPVVLEASSP